MYYFGNGMPFDDRQSLKWAKRAAKTGNEAALLLLSCIYQDVDSIAHDFRKAVFWFRRAAELGEVIGQYHLGLMYFKGRGVTQDYIEAYKWFILAAAQGSQEAHDAATKLKTSVSNKRCLQSIIDKGERRAKEFKPRSPDSLTGTYYLGLWIRSFPFWNPPTGIELVRTFWMFFCLLGSLFLLIYFVGEYKTSAVTHLGYGAVGVGFMSAIGLIILGIRKMCRKLQT